MKQLTTITEYQLLFLAKQELLRRIDELAAGIVTGDTSLPKDITKALYKMDCEQLAEISARMDEINRGE